MGIYKRGKKLWIAYSISKELADQHGCSRLQREPVGSGVQADAQALYKRRLREVKELSWYPRHKATARGKSVHDYAQTWAAQATARGVRTAWEYMGVLEVLLEDGLGAKRVQDVTRRDVLRAVEAMGRKTGKRGKAKGKPYAPKTVIKAYAYLRSMFAQAVRDEVIQSSPCNLSARAGELPMPRDADPRWRATAVFTRSELEALISDERIPEPRRVFYALLIYTGMRLGEAAGRRWSDYDTEATPLGRLVVATQYDDKPLKTDVPREVPVHPELAKILAAWKLGGYALHYGAHAKPGDFIVRNLHGGMIRSGLAIYMFRQDLELIGLRRRRLHDLRRSHVTLCRADGARPDLLRFVSHGPSASMTDLYTTPTWASLCEQVGCLQLRPRAGNVVSIKNARGG